MEIIKLSGLKCGRGRLQEVVVLLVDSNCKVLTGKVSVFCLGGRLWEADAYERGGRTWKFDRLPVYFISIFLLFVHTVVYFSSNLFLEGSKLVNCERLLRLPL